MAMLVVSRESPRRKETTPNQTIFMTDTATTQDCACQVDPWQGFKTGVWTESINVRDFIQLNYTPYTGEGDYETVETRDVGEWDDFGFGF